MESHGSTKDQKRKWSRDVYYSQVLEQVHGTLKGPHREIKARGRQRKSRAWAHAFIKVYEWHALVSWAKARSVSSNQKEWGFGKLKGVQMKVALRDGGDYLSQRLFGRSYQELTFACDSGGCYLVYALA